jgi:hypothetical protein
MCCGNNIRSGENEQCGDNDFIDAIMSRPATNRIIEYKHIGKKEITHDFSP